MMITTYRPIQWKIAVIEDLILAFAAIANIFWKAVGQRHIQNVKKCTGKQE